MSETIFALATPPGRGAVAMIRISGADAGHAVRRLAGVSALVARRASLRRLRTEHGNVLDEALVLWFPGPQSFTGEDCAELHLHGGAAVVAGVVEALTALGLKPANPGEFTRRAFEHGRLDLPAAEAIADLVDAETSAQREQALAQLGGALSRRYEDWRETLMEALALLEVVVDFPDEDVPGEVSAAALPLIQAVMSDMAASIADARGERVRRGIRIALIGAPNVGKSSLINALSARDVAIVTDLAGTTRDVIEVGLNVGGQLVHLADTAGLRHGGDVVEAEGVRRALVLAEEADMRLGVVDRQRAETLPTALERLRSGDVLVINKADLPSRLSHVEVPLDIAVVQATATTAGVADLMRLLVGRVQRHGPAGAFPAVTQARHRHMLEEALGELQRAAQDLTQPELASEGVRLAVRSLERVVGRSNPEAVLDKVFSRFCLGK